MGGVEHNGSTIAADLALDFVDSGTIWSIADDAPNTRVTISVDLPVGMMSPYAGASAPTGYALCDGSALSRTTYGALFALIGASYGAGDGSTTFNIPDLRGRVPIGPGTNASVDALGASDGVAVADRRPQHQHTVHDHVQTPTNIRLVENTLVAGTTAVYMLDDDAPGATSTGNADGGSAVATDPLDAPAWQVVNYVIKT